MASLGEVFHKHPAPPSLVCGDKIGCISSSNAVKAAIEETSQAFGGALCKEALRRTPNSTTIKKQVEWFNPRRVAFEQPFRVVHLDFAQVKVKLTAWAAYRDEQYSGAEWHFLWLLCCGRSRDRSGRCWEACYGCFGPNPSPMR